MRIAVPLLLIASSAAARTEEFATLEREPVEIDSIAFSADGRLLATAAYDTRNPNEGGAIKIYDVASRKKLRSFTAPALAVKLSPDGSLLAVATQAEGLAVFEVATGFERMRFVQNDAAAVKVRPSNAGTYDDLAFSRDGKLLAAATKSSGGHVHVFDLAARRRVIAIDTSVSTNQRITTIAISPDGKRVATGGGDAPTDLWSVSDGKKLATHGEGASVVAFSPDGARLAIAKNPLDKAPIEIVDGKTLAKLGDLGSQRGLTTLAFSADGKRLAAAGIESVARVFYLEGSLDDARVEQLIGSNRAVINIAISPDGKVVAAGGADKVVRLWNVPNKGD